MLHCNKQTLDNFLHIHKSVAKIQYFQQYAHQAIIFRDAADPSFAEAVSETIKLVANTPSYINRGLFIER